MSFEEAEEEEDEYDEHKDDDDDDDDNSPLKTAFSSRARLKIQRAGLLATLSKLGKSLNIHLIDHYH